MAKKRVKARKRAAGIVALQPRRRIEVIFSKKEYGKAPVEKHFVLQDGRKIGSLFQLADELETMGEETFRRYVTELKNDFATWARDVFDVPALADEMQKVRDRIGMQRAVMKHLLRDIAHVAGKQHREHAAKAEESAHKAEPRKGAKLVIHNP